MACNGNETCETVSGICQPGTSTCMGPTPFCDVSDDACVACLVDGDCVGGDRCANGACVECITDGDCGGGYCASNVCVDCTQNGHCDDGLFCNGAETCQGGSCALGTPPCTDDPNGPACLESTDTCVECANDNDCGGSTPYCYFDNTCRMCRLSSHCGPQEVCEPPGFCIPECIEKALCP